MQSFASMTALVVIDALFIVVLAQASTQSALKLNGLSSDIVTVGLDAVVRQHDAV